MEFLNSMKKATGMFLAAFLLNAVWEHAHSFLYLSYQGGAITELILFRAAFFDACMLTVLVLPFFRYAPLQRRAWLIVVLGIAIAIPIEWWALATERWVYAEAMPLVPFLKAGITPAVQLGITGYLSYRLSESIVKQ